MGRCQRQVAPAGADVQGTGSVVIMVMEEAWTESREVVLMYNV